MKEKTFIEGKAEILCFEDKIVSKDLPVFYNPIMRFNRDITIAAIQALEVKQYADIMSASGVRGIRAKLETNVEEVFLNDYSKESVELIKKNIEKNKVTDINISQEDANDFLLNSAGFQFIDIDPFGSPNPFLDSAVKRAQRKGFIAITATDTAPLAGAWEKTCNRKYWAKPLKNYLMHEMGVRILIRKAQLVGMQYDKALFPIISFYKDHYYRIIFKVEKGKEKCDELYKDFKHLQMKGVDFEIGNSGAGPFYAGSINDTKIIQKVLEFFQNSNYSDINMVETLLEQSKIKKPFFYDVHETISQEKLPGKKSELIIKELQEKGFKASRTIFNKYGIKTDADYNTFLTVIKQ